MEGRADNEKCNAPPSHAVQEEYVLSLIVRESLELSVAERPAPFPDEKVKKEKVHPSIRVAVDEEGEEEGEMVTTDALTVTASGEEEEVAMIEVRVSVPSV